MKKGFTLIELSIVLVIIGLLIGGILVGKSLRDSAAISAQVTQIQQFDAAVINYKMMYKRLPGDINRNNVLNGQYGDNCFACEMANFWNNLFPKLFQGVACQPWLPGQPALTDGPNRSVPAAKIGKSKSFLVASTITSGGWGIPGGGNYYAIFDPSQLKVLPGLLYYMATSSASNSPVTPQDAVSLDNKIDDRIGNVGYVRSGGVSNGVVSTPLSACSSSSTGVYNVVSGASVCTPLIRIGAQAGNPQ